MDIKIDSTKQILENLNVQIDAGAEIIKTKDYASRSIFSWYVRVKGLLSKIYKDDDPIIQKQREIFLKIRHKDIPPENFVKMYSAVLAVAKLLNNIKKGNESTACPPPTNNNVFIIHGHDEINMLKLKNILADNLKLNPVIMMAKPGMSRPLLTKFEDEASKCSFAFALFTPDDQVIQKNDNERTEYSQARQNVVNETGWFIGRLGKERLVILLKNGTKIHTDYDGVSRIQFKDSIDEKFLAIQEELKAVGLA